MQCEVLVDFIKKLKEFNKQINDLESGLYLGEKRYREIYELNQKLEAEIEQRTKDLETANRQMLTLQHILDMMTSSKPLSGVLNAIVNSLQKELGYLHSCIIRMVKENDKQLIEITAHSDDDFSSEFETIVQTPIYESKIKYIKNDGIDEYIKANIAYSTNNLGECFHKFFPDINLQLQNQLFAKAGALSCILIPLTVDREHYGSLLVLSKREETTDAELNFLKMFARQIELAITISNLFQAVKSQAISDALTGLYNRRYFEESIKKETIRANRQNQKFSVIGLDLDYLKQINDKYGHNYGDIAIKTIAEVLKKNARSIDVPARIGGEEFNIILPGIDSEGAMAAAERIRKAIENQNIPIIGKITASLGVATFFEQTDDVDELLELTDHAMYQSKHDGRNRVTLAKPTKDISWQEVAFNTFIDILSKHRVPLESEISDNISKKLETIGINNDGLYTISDTMIKLYNPNYTPGITKSKVLLANSLAKRFDMPKDRIDNLKIAILLYDIGNILLPKQILQKKAPLTDEEKNTIKSHPIIAAREILEPISGMNVILPIIENHHENWDGTGYPNEVSGNKIPIESQMILLIDAYFALQEPRSYRKAVDKEEAIEIIKTGSGTKWNPKLVEEFISIIETEEF